MQLSIKKRSLEKKKESKRIRREGDIPAILYGPAGEPESVTVNGVEFQTHLRHIPKNGLSTTIFTLKDEEGNERRAIVKDIQYKVTNYRILHIDLEWLKDDSLVNLKVPVTLVGAEACVGVKLGGVVRPVIRQLKVRCLPGVIPVEFKLDVTKLGIKQSLRLRDIDLPEGVSPLVDLNEVAVTIAKR